MKKLSLLLFCTLYIFVCKAQTQNFNTLNAQENLFDNIWWARGAHGFDGKTLILETAKNGEEVGRLNTKKGGVNINYTGRIKTFVPGQNWPVLTMDGKIPSLIDDNWLAFKNVASTYYFSQDVAPISPPYETWFVFRVLPNAIYEAYFMSGGNCGYVANAGNQMRIINAGGILPNSKAPTLFQTHIGRLVINSQTSATLYIDNVSQGTMILKEDANRMFKDGFSVGAVTNNPDWDFAAMYFKKGAFSSAEVTAVYNSLAAKWGQGTYPNQILLTKIAWTKKNGVYTPSAIIIKTPAGVKVADPSKWDYQWYWRNNRDNLDIQTPLSTKYKLTAADFPPGYAKTPGNFALKVTIRPKDTNGNSWRYFDGTFDNY
jgi:hypothetical protein